MTILVELPACVVGGPGMGIGSKGASAEQLCGFGEVDEDEGDWADEEDPPRVVRTQGQRRVLPKGRPKVQPRVAQFCASVVLDQKMKFMGMLLPRLKFLILGES